MLCWVLLYCLVLPCVRVCCCRARGCSFITHQKREEAVGVRVVQHADEQRLAELEGARELRQHLQRRCALLSVMEK
jgi:hypothetical protein